MPGSDGHRREAARPAGIPIEPASGSRMHAAIVEATRESLR
jgi:hypothetical protein